jgi:L-amino acid N-acyltransferase YncA
LFFIPKEKHNFISNLSKMLNIRKATLNDLEIIRLIYNDAILNTTATFDTEIKSSSDRKEWFENRDENFPIIVAVISEEVVGYAALNKWSERKAYDITAEISLYILPDFRGKGIGKRLIETICSEAKQTKLTNLIARITEGNESSIYLHKMNGFDYVGVLKKCGQKFGRILDVTLMQKML